MTKNIKQDLSFIFWITLCVFISLSLLSFSPYDPSFNSIGQEFSEIKNFCGIVGAFLSDMLFQFLGLGVIVLVCMCLIWSWYTFKGESALKAQVFLSILTINFCSLLSLFFSKTYLFQDYIPIGGLVGALVVKSLLPLLSFYGMTLVLVSSFLGLIVFSTNISLSQGWKTLSKTQAHIKTGFKILAFLWFSFFESFFSFTKYLFQKLKALFVSLKPISQEGKLLEVDFPAKPEEEDTVDQQAQDPDVLNIGPETSSEHEVKQPMFIIPERQKSSSTSSSSSSSSSSSPSSSHKPFSKKWKLPPLSLLEKSPPTKDRENKKFSDTRGEILKNKLAQFKIQGEITGVKSGPAVTLFEFKPHSNVKISRITDLADDLCLALSCESVRILAPIPGRDVVGVEVSNEKRQTVCLREGIEQKEFWSQDTKLPLYLGKSAEGKPSIIDLAKIPHTLVAGTTGSGKSVFVVSCLASLIFKHTPETLKLILVDPKQVDLNVFGKLPHLIMPILKTPKKALMALKWSIREMDKRYRSMSHFEARDLDSFNKKMKSLSAQELKEHKIKNESLPEKEQYYYTPQALIVILVEEFGDLMAMEKNQIEPLVVRLAQMARACGIHLILAMQSPRKDVVTGLIKTNIPGRISFKVASSLDSRIILDEVGAERLLARGDMLFMSPSTARARRHHAAWVSEEELSSVLKHWFSQGEPELVETFSEKFNVKNPSYDGSAPQSQLEDDDKYEDLMAFLSTQKHISASLIQRRLSLGYPRAARLIELLEQKGLVGPANGSKPRKVLGAMES